MPCKIEHTGKANVQRYFIVDEEKKESAFRGRKLCAKELALSENAKGFVLEKSKGDTTWRCIGKFEKINLWEADDHKGTRDLHASNIQDWIDISNLVNLKSLKKRILILI